MKHEGVQISKLLINYATKHIVRKILHINITSGYFNDIYQSNHNLHKFSYVYIAKEIVTVKVQDLYD